MKTLIYLPTLLALIIQVMVNGQTPENQASRRTLPVLGAKTQNKTTSTQAQKERVYPTLISSDQPEIKAPETNNTKLAQTISQLTEVQNPVTVIDNNTFNYYNNANCYSTMVYVNELLKQADDLSLIEKTLRSEAKTKQGAEQTQLINSANQLVKQIEIKQIQASEISGKISVEKFNQNTITLYTLIEKNIIDERISDEAKDLNNDASHLIKMAKEMREEAYSMKTNAAKLGTMNNAEEKELAALNEQDAALLKIKKSIASINNKIQNDLVTK
jgi:hypothetical protein